MTTTTTPRERGGPLLRAERHHDRRRGSRRRRGRSGRAAFCRRPGTGSRGSVDAASVSTARRRGGFGFGFGFGFWFSPLLLLLRRRRRSCRSWTRRCSPRDTLATTVSSTTTSSIARLAASEVVPGVATSLSHACLRSSAALGLLSGAFSKHRDKKSRNASLRVVPYEAMSGWSS